MLHDWTSKCLEFVSKSQLSLIGCVFISKLSLQKCCPVYFSFDCLYYKFHNCLDQKTSLKSCSIISIGFESVVKKNGKSVVLQLTCSALQNHVLDGKIWRKVNKIKIFYLIHRKTHNPQNNYKKFLQSVEKSLF